MKTVQTAEQMRLKAFKCADKTLEDLYDTIDIKARNGETKLCLGDRVLSRLEELRLQHLGYKIGIIDKNNRTWIIWE